jgi:hypothetical protein
MPKAQDSRRYGGLGVTGRAKPRAEHAPHLLKSGIGMAGFEPAMDQLHTPKTRSENDDYTNTFAAGGANIAPCRPTTVSQKSRRFRPVYRLALTGSA